MEVKQILTDQPLTQPFRTNNGITFCLRSGDICHPLGIGDWFKPPYFSRVFKFKCNWYILPFISYRFRNRVGYIGFKCYGVDSEAYKNWLNPDDVYDGSLAVHFSIRLFGTIGK